VLSPARAPHARSKLTEFHRSEIAVEKGKAFLDQLVTRHGMICIASLRVLVFRRRPQEIEHRKYEVKDGERAKLSLGWPGLEAAFEEITLKRPGDQHQDPAEEGGSNPHPKDRADAKPASRK